MGHALLHRKMYDQLILNMLCADKQYSKEETMKRNHLNKMYSRILASGLIVSMLLTGCGGAAGGSESGAGESEAVTESEAEGEDQAKEATGNIIIYNGNVEQVVGDNEDATAIVIDETGNIVYVGDDEGTKEFENDTTKKYDAKGNTIMPSMVESHIHFSTAMQAMYEINITDLIETEDMQACIKEFMEEQPDLEVYTGTGWGQSAFDVEIGPTADILDELCPDKPMVLQNVDGHGYWANTKALEYVEEQLAKGVEGVRGNTVAEYNEHFQENGGRIIVDENGKPSGWLKESAGSLINGLLPVFTVDQCKEAILEQQDWLASLGFTTFYDAGVLMNEETADNYFIAMSELAKDDLLKVRVRSSFWVQPYEFNVLDDEGNYDAEASSAALDEYLEGWKKKSEELSVGDNFRITTLKFMADQVLEGGTAYMCKGKYSDEYVNANLGGDSEKNNVWAGKEPLMEQAFVWAAENGYNLHVHSIGDAAATLALDALEDVISEYPELKENRVCLAHCQFINDEDKKRMGELGVSAIVAPYWAIMDDYYWDVYLPIMSSQEVLDEQYPMQSLVENNVNVAFHSDYVVTVPDMGWLYFAALTRTMPQKVFDNWYGGFEEYYKRDTDPNASHNREDYPEDITPILTLEDYDERLNFKQTLEASTINGAKTINLEDEIGSLEVGKKGDVIVLNMDIANAAEKTIEEVENVAPVLTICAGEILYDAENA